MMENRQLLGELSDLQARKDSRNAAKMGAIWLPSHFLNAKDTVGGE
jgi:hypothetical protein